MFATKRYLILTTVLAALIAPDAEAQEMTAQDILKRLQAQRTRTLAFAKESTPDDMGEETSLTAQGVPAEGDTMANSGGLQLTPVGDLDANGDQIAAMPVSAESQSMEASLSIDLTVYFDFDSAVLQAKSKTQLNALCQAIQADSGDGQYQIIGHTDSKGRAAYNMRLSKARADEVVRYMVGECGIDSDRLKPVGQGELRPVAGTDPRDAKNRRVEVQVLS